MSTKTTFKRVALVAVAALGFGVLSVVPSQATTQADSLTLSAATAAQTTAETYTATSATATLAFISENAGDTMSVTASLVSTPAGATALPYLRVVETTSAIVSTSATGNAQAVGDATVLKQFVRSSDGSAIKSVKAKLAVYLGEGDQKTAPTVAGTYVVKLTPAVVAGGGTLNATAQTLTITVSDAPSLSTIPNAALSTVRLTRSETITPTTASTDDVVSFAKTVSSTVKHAAIISITQKNAANGDASESVTAIVSGVGLINSGTVAAGATVAAFSSPKGRAITVKAGDAIQVWADGSAGTSTITLTSATSGVALGSKTVTFYSTTAAKLTAVTKRAYVLAGGVASGANATYAATTNTNSRVFQVNVLDADGRDMADALAVTAKPSTTADALIGKDGACAYTATTSTQAAGFYCSAPGYSATAFGKANYTFTVTNAAGDTVAATAAVTFADGVATKLTITGPASASVGEEVTLTLTATEKNGYPIADGSYEGAAASGIFWNTTTVPAYSSSSFQPFNAGETITTVSGVATKKLYVPVTAGSVKATWTLAGSSTTAAGAIDKTIGGTTVVYTASVTNPGVDAATDAANEATDAANAATDAANAAAEAADAATAAAQDAADAVAALSTQVNDLISALKKQITSLTSIVVKIQKKLGIK